VGRQYQRRPRVRAPVQAEAEQAAETESAD